MHGHPLRTGSDGAYRAQADINVTPLVDVVLVLLIIFMVTAPMLAAGIHVDLPQAKAARTLKPEKPIVLTVTKDGAITLGQETLQLDQVAAAIERQNGPDRSAAIHVQADKTANYGVFVALLDVLATHAYTHIAIVTTPAAMRSPNDTPLTAQPVPPESRDR